MITVVRKTIEHPSGDPILRTSRECTSRGGAIRVKCTDCGWTGYRRGLECCCYDEYAWYCRPWSPGPGCPSGILYGCPRCATKKTKARGHRFPGDAMSGPHNEPQL